MDFNLARKNMVESQIRPNHVKDIKVIDAFAKVPREKFLPNSLLSIAYIDDEIQIVRNRSMMKPMILARFYQEMKLSKDDTVLHIGSNFGYGSAVLSQLCKAVISLEGDKKLFEKSSESLLSLGIDNVFPLHGNMEAGFDEEAPFDIIFIEGAIEEIPEPLFNQLSLNGRLATIMKPKDNIIGKGYIFKKLDLGIDEREIFDANSIKLPIFKSKSNFIF